MAMRENGNEPRECFGILDTVFPMGQAGLREVPPSCFACPDRVSCLKTAMLTTEGIRMRNDALDRAASADMIGRLRRWSRKKELSRLLKEQEEKPG